MRTIPKIIHTLKMLGFRRTSSFFIDLAAGRHPLPFRETNPDFERRIEEADTRLVIDRRRAHMLLQFASAAQSRPGDMAEVGVYKGGTAKLIASVGKNKLLHLFDTFTGLPSGRTDEFMRKGDFSDTSIKDVQAFIGDAARVQFHPGLFPDTAKAVADQTFCFVHLDVDLHEPTLAGLRFFHPRLTNGGVILVDDYGSVTCPGVKDAVDRFCEESGARSIYLPTGQTFIPSV